MRPEEFTAALRGEIAVALPKQVQAIRGVLESRGQVTKELLENFLSSPAKVLSEAGLLASRETTRINHIVWAIHRSKKINHFMSRLAMKYEADPALAGTLNNLTKAPEKVDLKELQVFLDSALSDESLHTQALRVLLEDEGVREALELPPDLSFERYMWDLRRAVKHAKTIDEITKVSNLGPEGGIAFTAVAAAVAIVALATLAVVVHAAAVVWNYVAALVVVKWGAAFTVSGPSPLAGPILDATGQRVADDSTKVPTIVENGTRKIIWLVYPTPIAHVRVPIAPAKRSDEVARGVPKAILIGGQHNELGTLQLPGAGKRSEGVYKIYDGAHVRLLQQRDDSTVTVVEDEIQRVAVITERAGWLDDPDLCMSRIAAAVPPGLDVDSLASESHETARFYQSLRVARQLGRLHL